MNLNNKLNKLLTITVYFVMFLFLLVFFIKIHPLIIYDADDWTYIASHREFIPLWEAWNPAKLFPETLMPICGSIATFVINPIIHDYLKSITIVTSFVVSTTIILYILMFVKMITKRFHLSHNRSMLLGVLFFLFHFLLLLVGQNNNQYMFLAHNVNCYYNYLIPNLLNFIVVFYFLSREKIDFSISSLKNIKSGFLLLVLYIAIFSNLFCNIILGVFAGVELLIKFIQEIRKKGFKLFIKDYFILIVILISWVISVIFELSGGRAKLTYNASYIYGLIKCIKNLFYSLLHNINSLIFVLSIIIVIVFFILIIKDKIIKKNKKEAVLYLRFILYAFIIALYYLLICPKIGPEYILRIEDVFGLYSYCLIFIFLCLVYILKKYPRLIIVFPIIICYFAVEVNGALETFKESNSQNISPLLCEKIDIDIINQITEADVKGLSNVKVYVPKNNTSDNWPQALYLGKRISHTLFKHRIIKREIGIEIVPSNIKNIEYNINN